MTNGSANGDWEAIPGFDGKYEINRAGEVRSWKPWAGDKRPLPRAMRVQHVNGRRVIQLGLHGGTHDVDRLVAVLFADECPRCGGLMSYDEAEAGQCAAQDCLWKRGDAVVHDEDGPP